MTTPEGWTADEITQLLALDGKPSTIRLTHPVEDVDGNLIGVDVEEPTGTFHVPWGAAGFPDHPEAS